MLLQFLKGRSTLYEFVCVLRAGVASDFVHNIMYIGKGSFVGGGLEEIEVARGFVLRQIWLSGKHIVFTNILCLLGAASQVSSCSISRCPLTSCFRPGTL